MNIEGNEAADRYADEGTRAESLDPGLPSEATYSGKGTIMRAKRDAQRAEWWSSREVNLSPHYKSFLLPYEVKMPPELRLDRPTLHHLLALRTGHGDFKWYHEKFDHPDAKLVCSCGKNKSPDHIVRCSKSLRRFTYWPDRPSLPPTNKSEARRYLRHLCANPQKFAKLLAVTQFYAKICPRR